MTTTTQPPRGGSCAGLPTAWFFEGRDVEPLITADGRVLVADPAPTTAERAAQRHAVASACRSCPIRSGCLLYALDANLEHGIWAGAGEARRRALRRARADGNLAAAMAAHWRRLDGEPRHPGDRELLAAFADNATHGTAATYAKGCPCEACRLAIGGREVAASLARRPATRQAPSPASRGVAA